MREGGTSERTGPGSLIMRWRGLLLLMGEKDREVSEDKAHNNVITEPS